MCVLNKQRIPLHHPIPTIYHCTHRDNLNPNPDRCYNNLLQDHQLEEDKDRVFMLVVATCDVMTVDFVFKVVNDGSWRSEPERNWNGE